MNVGVLASGRGSNFEAIAKEIKAGGIPGAKIALVVSDKRDAKVHEKAKGFGIESLYLEPKDYESREEYDKAVAEEFDKREVGLILLAGYMRLVSPWFVGHFRNKIMNIHPALLPSFPGTHGQKDAVDYGAKVSGCTVHFVDEGLDTGPIIVQRAVEVEDDDTEDTLAARILEQEHKAYPEAVRLFAAGKIRVDGRRVTILG